MTDYPVAAAKLIHTPLLAFGSSVRDSGMYCWNELGRFDKIKSWLVNKIQVNNSNSAYGFWKSHAVTA